MLPPGFRFHPTDEELVGYYLTKKVRGIPMQFDVIANVDLYKCEPWELPSKGILPGRDSEWFFFSPTDRKYAGSSRTNRATECGFWKATGRDRFVKKSGSKMVIGMKKTLVFHSGRAPHGERTQWVMHEYRLDEAAFRVAECDDSLQESGRNAVVLCKVFKKGGFDRAVISVAAGDGGVGEEEEEEEDNVVSELEERRNSVLLENDVKPNLELLPQQQQQENDVKLNLELLNPQQQKQQQELLWLTTTGAAPTAVAGGQQALEALPLASVAAPRHSSGALFDGFDIGGMSFHK